MWDEKAKFTVKLPSAATLRVKRSIDKGQYGFGNGYSIDDSNISTGSPLVPEIDSMDFFESETIMWRQNHIRRYLNDINDWWNPSRRATAWKWSLVCILGILVGAVGFFVGYFANLLNKWKFAVMTTLINKNEYTAAFFAYVAFCTMYGCIAGCCACVAPGVAGGGIVQIKAFLNGIKLDEYVRTVILVPKIIGVCAANATGLPLGIEGPMVHVGSICGAAICQGKSEFLGVDFSFSKLQDLRNDEAKRDFVTYGAAAGIAAAFRAPVGGILFVLEEGASFWSPTVTFRSFLCAIMTQLVVLIIQRSREISKGILAFGSFPDLTEGKTNFYWYEMPLFTAMGASGGLIGYLWNKFYCYVEDRRILYVGPEKRWKFVEMVCLVAMFGAVQFLLSIAWRVCTPLPTTTVDFTTEEQDLLNDLVQFQCDENEYNQVASLYLVGQDTAIRQLFHFREYDGSEWRTFDTGALLIFFLPYITMAPLTPGIFMPAGLFVPAILAGATYGRIIGHVMNKIAPGHVADAGSYALIGSACILGGIQRMTVAGTAIIMEASGNTTYVLPVMLAFLAARYAGNVWGAGFLDIQMSRLKLPFLEAHIQQLGILGCNPISAYMSKPVAVLGEIETVANVVNLLRTTPFNGFPVVKEKKLVGIILRKHLTTLLQVRAFSVPKDRNEPGSELQDVPPVFYETFEKKYPRYPDISLIEVSEEDEANFLDLRPYFDSAPFIISETTSITRAYNVFRGAGCRHMIVCNETHEVVGILTRRNLTEHKLDTVGYAIMKGGIAFDESSKIPELTSLKNLPPALIPVNISKK
jgi:chloride channel 7